MIGGRSWGLGRIWRGKVVRCDAGAVYDAVYDMPRKVRYHDGVSSAVESRWHGLSEVEVEVVQELVYHRKSR